MHVWTHVIASPCAPVRDKKLTENLVCSALHCTLVMSLSLILFKYIIWKTLGRPSAIWGFALTFDFGHRQFWNKNMTILTIHV